MSDDLIVYGERPMTAVDVRAQVNLIQQVMQGVMKSGQHYGVIPGAGDKPTLLKAGAEKIMTTFRLAAEPVVEDLSLADVMRYRVTCRLLMQSSGNFVGAGVGECSSDEEKYKWRFAVSEAEWNATPEDRRRIKYKREGQIKQVRTNPADVANTILKMAKKRALVDAVLTVTAASDIFTQDIEDMPEEVLKPPVSQPQAKASTSAQPKNEPTDLKITRTMIADVSSKPTAKGGKYYTIAGDGGELFHTFDDKKAEVAEMTKAAGAQAEIKFTVDDKYGNKIHDIVTIEPGSDG